MPKAHKHKIGVFGSGVSGSPAVTKKAKDLGIALAKYKTIVITGACSGLPYATAHAAAERGSEVWGFSPEQNLAGQRRFTPKDDISIYKKLIYIPKNFSSRADPKICKKYRNVMSTAASDAGIIIAGRWGTMNEVTNLYDYGKVIGVLIGTGGISAELARLNKKIHKPSAAKFIFNSSPQKLVSEVIKELNRRNK
jgi:predicted Rossmann-fold nucleotide-binding protein